MSVTITVDNMMWAEGHTLMSVECRKELMYVENWIRQPSTTLSIRGWLSGQGQLVNDESGGQVRFDEVPSGQADDEHEVQVVHPDPEQQDTGGQAVQSSGVGVQSGAVSQSDPAPEPLSFIKVNLK